MPNSVSIVHNINAVHPINYDADININGSVTTNCNNEKLFLASNRHEKTVFIEVKNDRIIHVKQYAHNIADLFSNGIVWKSQILKTSSLLLFFVHGVGASSQIWDQQVNYFFKYGYDIVTVDLLGHGLSSAPKDFKAYEFTKLAEDVLETFDKFCKSSNILIGHSYGCSFCTLLAKERAHCVSKMVLISGGGPTALFPEKCSAFSLPMPIFFIYKPLLVRIFLRKAFHASTTEVKINKGVTFQISSYTLKAVMQGQKWPFSNEQYYSDLLIPIILIHGKEDQFISLEDEIWMKQTVYGAELKIIDNAGHMSMVESPAVVNKHIHEFLNRDSSSCTNHYEEITS